jgi:hypothetical protein
MPQHLPVSITLSIMPCSTVSSLALHKKRNKSTVGIHIYL